MYRIRLTLPKRMASGYRNLDLLHDALVNGWTAAGAASDQVVGPSAGLWTFAPLGWRANGENRAHTLVVSTADARLAEVLARLTPDQVRHRRPATGEAVDFAAATVTESPDPVVPDSRALGVLMLSPLAISHRENGTRRWQTRLDAGDPGAAISERLTRLAGRPVRLGITPDRLYLRATPRHDTLVPLKTFPNGRRSFVIGMRAPLLIEGAPEDLRLAWYAGIGEKTRFGFGCVGLAEKGVGR